MMSTRAFRMLLVAGALLVAVPVREAAASRAYFDGALQSNATFCPVTNNYVTVLNTYTGYFTDPNEPYPKTGDLGYVHAVAVNVAPCVADGPGFDFFPPDGATLAISTANPVFCIRGKLDGTFWEYVPNDDNGGCSQTPQIGTYGGYFFGWSSLPPGWYLDVRVPVVYNKQLLGLGGPNSHRLTAATSSAYGALFPYQPVTVFYETDFQSLASSNVGSGTASVAFNLVSYYKGGLLYIDYGTTQSFGTSLPGTTVPDTGLQYPVTANLAGLTPSTPYYWRARYVTTSGTFTSPTQAFTTTGATTPQTLTVSKTGTGSGSVTSNPAGITCGATCSAQFAFNTGVSLTATGATGSRFSSWTTGPCTGSTNSVCAVTMNQPQGLTAAFSRDMGSLSLTVGGLPAGTAVTLGMTGPDGFNQTRSVMTGTGVNLSDVPTGSYTVTAPTAMANGTLYAPNQASQTATVSFGTTATVSVTYSVAPPLPGAFGKVGPGNGAAGQSTGPALSWGASNGAAGYEYCADTSNDGACAGGWVSTGTSTGATLGGLGAGTTYYWQVRARNAAGTTDANAGAWWSFATNASPVAQDDFASTIAGVPVTVVVLANDSDPDGGPLAVAILTPPAHGSATVSAGDGSVTYAPSAGFSGTDTFIYAVTDPGGASDTARVTLKVANGFFEDFADGVADRWKGSPAKAWSVAGGVLRAQGLLRSPQALQARYEERFTNFTYGANVRLASGSLLSLGRGMGLLLRTDDTYRTGYVFQINAAGSYQILKLVPGQLPLALKGWTPHAAIRKGRGRWNRLEVDCAGPALTFVINGKQVARLKDPSFSRGKAGLRALGSGVLGERFEFDVLRLVAK